MSIALLIARIILGLGIAAHGAQKLFGWYGGYGLKGTGGFFESLGYRPGVLFALAAGLGEFLGGVLTFLGIGGPIGPALVIVVMLTAILTVHVGYGFFTAKNGPELPLMYAAGALLIALASPGLYSLDTVLGYTGLWQTGTAWIAVGAAIVAALLNIAARRRPEQKPATQTQ